MAAPFALLLLFGKSLTPSAKSFGTSLKGIRLNYQVEHEIFSWNCSVAEAPCAMHHFWCGGTFPGYGKSLLKYYVDDLPPVIVPLGPGHGMGSQTDDNGPWSSGAQFGRSGVGLHAAGADAGSGFFNTHQIPFGKKINVTISIWGEPVGAAQYFWLILRGRTNAKIVLPGGLGDPLPSEARVRSYQSTTNYLPAYSFLPVISSCASKGAVLFTTLEVRSPRGHFSFLEGEYRAQSSSDNKPWLLSSGTEDYFLGTFYFDKGQYFFPLAGVTSFCPQPKDGAPRNPSIGCTPSEDGSIKFSAYRVHGGLEPLLFEDGLNMTWRNGEPGHGGQVQPINASSYALVYEW